jgi:superfamily I DNA/RNA helicase
MEKIKAPTKVLSKSFRYGQEIADLATFIIDGSIQVKGMESIASKITKIDSEQYTKIFRTNSALLSEAVRLIEQGAKVKCEIDPKKFKSMINSSYALFKEDNANIKDDEIAVYATWSEMLDDAKDNPEIKRLTDIVLNHKTFTYTKALDTLIKDSKSNKPYDIILTTAHKSKGMEWSNVIIADDFNTETILKSVGDSGYNQQEVNLFYVACTRAINTIQLPKDFLEEYQYSLEELENEQEDYDD